MKKAYRVKNSHEYQAVFKDGQSFANRQLVIYFKKKEEQRHFRVGISVGTKIGNAVVRNRIKRKIRHICQELDNHIYETYDIIIIARNPAVDMSYQQLKKSLLHLLKKKNLYK